MQTALQVSDGINGYTYSLKTEKGQQHPELAMFQHIEIKNAGLTTEKGMRRLTGEYVPG
ncbi:hypothetical protein HW115_01390 [Verrucomicrobiaceae bacterium N1E253]|uniref:Uncharacterized protein n=1 Tax=Oceaniferula marina TaxID=2748318 RepID=A0A851G956_9BACT|nr:hypothetical protein [Oceaniferula marina]NWK54248.1 hypothetical protein [Oceaniferula marina]